MAACHLGRVVPLHISCCAMQSHLQRRQVVRNLHSRVLIPLVAVVIGQVLVRIVVDTRVAATVADWLNCRAHHLWRQEGRTTCRKPHGQIKAGIDWLRLMAAALGLELYGLFQRDSWPFWEQLPGLLAGRLTKHAAYRAMNI